ncbi:hypothetical protein [Hafnia psychrotolerans]|uniref:Lipoprotein n=1 Tax=Hafnia psychrotolerans TaxID=1477018 RepID=A0ABQ1GT91_9GAMM|nr:hypothetical protein [Hafnia psychrotolerans]GGA49506.1 hypothetical protein GCM10011328_26030 [Hafnia psychrotolerans]
MKRTFIALVVFLAAGCSGKNPYQPAPQVLNGAVVTESQTNKTQSPEQNKTDQDKATQGKTIVRLHRMDQWTLVPFERTCPLYVRVDGQLVAALQFNEYVDLRLINGQRNIRVSLACTMTGRSASAVVDANGTRQEYETDSGWYGQLRLWRTK